MPLVETLHSENDSPLSVLLWAVSTLYSRLCTPEDPQLYLFSLRNDLCLHSMPWPSSLSHMQRFEGLQRTTKVASRGAMDSPWLIIAAAQPQRMHLLGRHPALKKKKLKIVVTNNTKIFLRAGTVYHGLAMTEMGQCGLTKQAGAALAVVGRTEEVPAVTTVWCNLNT